MWVLLPTREASTLCQELILENVILTLIVTLQSQMHWKWQNIESSTIILHLQVLIIAKEKIENNSDRIKKIIHQFFGEPKHLSNRPALVSETE